MFLTITANTALDRVIFIDEFAPETVMRTNRWITSVGGKGFDASVVYRAVGAETLAIGFMAGETGKQLARLLDSYGIQHDLIWVEGETRIAHVLVETTYDRHSHIIAGEMRISEDHQRRFLDTVHAHVAEADWVVCGGSLPKAVPVTFFQDVIEIAKQNGVPSLLDSSGEAALGTGTRQPTVLKMNRDEFAATFTVNPTSFTDLIRLGEQTYRQRDLETLVITCGGDGMLVFTAEGAFHAIAPRQQAVNAAGAGDAVSAALTWRLTLGDTWSDVLRWSAAVSAAVVLTEGTADCDITDVQRILPDVEVKKW